ncbi:MAG: FdtA/QdtA family cupin domain-containing protein [Bacteroidaceae bacterium]|nr:FdtA/QdtA family cupin domain-containing protein [Bacteroidaceae bacterium]
MASKKRNNHVRIINLGKIRDKRGNLSVVEGSTLPFKIARTYWIYDVPGGKDRGGHAYHCSHEVIIALSGSFEVYVNDGIREQTIRLEQCDKALYIPAGTWRHLCKFATNSTALVIASTPYSPRDYIRNFDHFIELKREKKL